MPKWLALLMLAAISAACLSGAGLILWFGAPALVRCDRGPEGRVDVTVERRVLGLLTIGTETVPDAIHAHSVSGSNFTGGGDSSLPNHVVMLIPRHRPERQASGIASPGGRPKAMARQIEEFINGSSDPSLTLWYVRWVLNLCAVPFVFVAGLTLFGLGEGLLRALGYFKPASVPTQEDS